MNSLLLLLLASPAALSQDLHNVTLHPGSVFEKCLEVRGGVIADYAAVQINDCDGDPGQLWTVEWGSSQIRVPGTNFCMDAGTDASGKHLVPVDGTGIQIWECVPGVVTQQWYLTADYRIALEGQGLCLDLTNGETSIGTQPQTWQCTDNNPNQVWYQGGTIIPIPPPSVLQLHPNYDITKCLDVRADTIADGTPVQIYDCNGTPAQDWLIQHGGTTVRLNGTNFCLDAGSSPANGVQMKIWQCYDDLPAQNWYYTNDHRIALLNQGFCLDLPNGNKTNSNVVQIWECTDNDVYQVWTD